LAGVGAGDRLGVNRAELEVLLEGVDLPATRPQLVRYAAEQGAGSGTLALLRALPEREYGAIDEVGEAIQPVQPDGAAPGPPPPRAESGEPPGGAAYTA
jgi:hypothetical protein